jgi:hypothetical protein
MTIAELSDDSVAPPAAHGLGPRQVANQLLRAFRAEADIMRVLGGWTPRVSENDERLAFARDIGFRAIGYARRMS